MIFRIDCLFVVEHKIREFPAIDMVANQLKNDFGINSVIVPLHYFSYILLIFKPKIIFLHFVRQQSEYPACFVSDVTNSTIVSLNWEQAIGKYNKLYKKVRDTFARKKVFHFSNSIQFTTYLQQQGIPISNIIETSNLQLVSSNMRYKEDTRKKLLSGRKFIIFVPLNCGYKFISNQEIKYRLNRGFNKNNLKRLIENANIYFDNLLSLALVIAKKHVDIQVIVRPRPNESVVHYFKYFSERNELIPNNLLISKEHAAHDVMLSSDIVISNFSTLVLDSEEYKIPSYFLSDNKASYEFCESDLLPMKNKLRTRNEFLKIVNKIKRVKVKTFSETKHDVTKLCFSIEKLIKKSGEEKNKVELIPYFKYYKLVLITLLKIFFQFCYKNFNVRKNKIDPDFFSPRIYK